MGQSLINSICIQNDIGGIYDHSSLIPPAIYQPQIEVEWVDSHLNAPIPTTAHNFISNKVNAVDLVRMPWQIYSYLVLLQIP